MNARFLRLIGLTALLSSVAPGAMSQTPQTLGWPIQPINADHPLAMTLGEFRKIGEYPPRQHEGVDILALPHPNDAAPWVVATVTSQVFVVQDSINGTDNSAELIGNDGNAYLYHHLAHGFSADLATGSVAQGQLIARVVAFGCGYDHLHYQVHQYNRGRTSAVKFINPMKDIGPRPDQQFPEVLMIEFARNGVPGSKFTDLAADGVSTVVSGKVDVVAQIRDRDDAGSNAPGTANVGVHKLRWRVCPSSAPTCPNWKDTHVYDEMSPDWAAPNNPYTPSHFSTTPPWVSTTDLCNATGNETFVIPSSYNGSSWDTSQLANGYYSVTVEAKDLANNPGMREVKVCVRNGSTGGGGVPCPPSVLTIDGDTTSSTCGLPC